MLTSSLFAAASALTVPCACGDRNGCINLSQVVLSRTRCVSSPMRFNAKEIAAVASQPSYKFEKEGVLLIKERQEGLFRRSDGKCPVRSAHLIPRILLESDKKCTLYPQAHCIVYLRTCGRKCRPEVVYCRLLARHVFMEGVS